MLVTDRLKIDASIVAPVKSTAMPAVLVSAKFQ